MKALSTLFTISLLLTACNDSSTPLNSLEEEAEAQEFAEELRAQQELAQLEPTDEDGDGYKTFTEDEYGISFDFPADWDFEIDSYGDGYRVDLSNIERTDWCGEGEAGVIFTFPNTKDATVSFEAFIHSSEIYNEGGSLGKLGGALTATTFAGRDAFHAEVTGYESMCDEDDGYVVEMDKSSYLFIGVFGNVDNAETEEIQKILDSLSIN